MIAATPSLAECHISVSQEEELAQIGGGWERNGHYNLDETPSQSHFFPTTNLPTSPPESYKGNESADSESSEESVDREGDLRCTQEHVELMSPASDYGVVKEDESDDSESDRSSHGEIEQAPVPTTLDMSADFFSQPVVGFSVDFELPEDLQRPEAFSLPLSTVPENTTPEAPVPLPESCIQPYTQAIEIQSLDFLYKVQVPAKQIQSAHGRDAVVRSPVVVDLERVDSDEFQQGRGQHELAKEASAVNRNARRSREQSPLDKGGVELTRHLGDTEPKQPGKSRDIPVIEILSSPEESDQAQPLSEGVAESEEAQPLSEGVAEESEEAQPLSEGVAEESEGAQSRREGDEDGTGRTNTNSDQTHRGNEEAQSGSKRVDSAQELPGQQKRQRAEPRVLYNRNTGMDVIRFRCPPPSTSTVDEDEEFLLSLIKKAGVRWPPLIRD